MSRRFKLEAHLLIWKHFSFIPRMVYVALPHFKFNQPELSPDVGTRIFNIRYEDTFRWMAFFPQTRAATKPIKASASANAPPATSSRQLSNFKAKDSGLIHQRFLNSESAAFAVTVEWSRAVVTLGNSLSKKRSSIK